MMLEPGNMWTQGGLSLVTMRLHAVLGLEMLLGRWPQWDSHRQLTGPASIGTVGD